jgi:Bardet-Biedl syndrome 1 protein
MSAFSSFMCLADLHADGDHRLIMVDLKKRIRIFKGTTIQWEQKLLDVPCAVQCFYHEVASPPIPTLAVASGHQVFIYRYMRPYLKFTLPPIGIDAAEQEVWEELRKEAIDVRSAYDKLNVAPRMVPLSQITQ